MKMKYLKFLALGLVIAACDSPLDTTPTTEVDAETALRTGAAIQQAVLGAYRGLASGDLYSREQVVQPDLYADNLDFTGTFQTDREYAEHNVTTANGTNEDIWQALYDNINRTNFILDALQTVQNMADEDKDVARGEALFLRGLNYSNLARWYGGVPIMTQPTKALNEESTKERNTLAEVRAFIEADLEEAATLLPDGPEEGRASVAAANALLARVYLENGKYDLARDKATSVIESGDYALVDNYRDLFTNKHTSESIFELHYAGGENTNALAFWFFDQSVGGRRGFQPSEDLFNAYEANDERRDASITIQGEDEDLLIGFKYFRIATQDDNVHILRLAEMYLIRAEANMRLAAAPATVRADIDEVRVRAGLAPLATTVDTQDELTDAILQERRVEFAMEGHRFFDLRRLGRATTVLGISADRLLMPIPRAEIDVNDSLEQNPGY
jgi:starch-binding outer membrane protein, SusD/RagB family